MVLSPPHPGTVTGLVVHRPGRFSLLVRFLQKGIERFGVHFSQRVDESGLVRNALPDFVHQGIDSCGLLVMGNECAPEEEHRCRQRFGSDVLDILKTEAVLLKQCDRLPGELQRVRCLIERKSDCLCHVPIPH